MARTTLAIDDDLLNRLKQRAHAQGKTLQALANELLRQAMARPARDKGYRLELPKWEAREQPGIDIRDRDRLWDRMDGRE